MLRLTLDMLPYGSEATSRRIGMLDIARTTPNNDPETYNVWAYAPSGELLDTFQVRDHSYHQGAWELVRRAVENYAMPHLR